MLRLNVARRLQARLSSLPAFSPSLTRHSLWPQHVHRSHRATQRFCPISILRSFFSFSPATAEPAPSPQPSPSPSASSASASPSTRPPLELQLGATYHNFTVTSITPVPEFNLTCYLFSHPSGCSFIHIDRDDSDCCFCITLRTPPASSSGIAHILEHTTLCGSQRFPVRDPFFLLTRRSLKTYMNAMTAQDFTMYPFSTTHETDFDNLLRVYLDSVFFPLLRRSDFMQEGHRLEYEAETAAEAAQQLSRKGVVYNEMKGAMSDGGQLFSQRLQSLLFSDPLCLYHWNSGGEPADIPTLSYEQLRDFHAAHYRPHNACFFSYGNRPPPLQRVDELVLSRLAGKAEGAAAVPPVAAYHPQSPPSAPLTFELSCPPDPLTPNPLKQTKVATAYLLPALSALPPAEQQLQSFALSILSSLLLDGPSSPMYQALVEPNIGNGYAPGTGYDGDSRQPSFSIGLQGIAEESVQQVQETVERVLQETRERGFELERVEAILHQLEVGVKHVTTHFGMSVMMRMMTAWAHELDPVDTLHLSRKVQYVRDQLERDPHFFSSLISRYLLDNPARVTLVMRPDESYAAKENEREREQLRQLEATLDDASRQRIRDEAAQLKQQQDTPSDPSILPSLSVSDIKKEAEIVNLQPLTLPASAAAAHIDTTPPVSAQLSASSAFPTLTAPLTTAASPFPPTVFLEAATNGCAYIRLLFDFRSLPAHLRPYFSLFSSFLTEMGAGPFDYRQLSHQLDLHTGGVGASLRIFPHRDDLLQHEELLLLRGMALTRNVDKLLSLLRWMLVEPRWAEEERLRQLLIQTAAGLSSSMQDSGHSYAKGSAASTLTPAAMVLEEMGGVQHVKRVNELVQRLEAGGDGALQLLRETSQRLLEISRAMLQQGLLRVMIVGDRDALNALERQLPDFLQAVSPSLSPPAAASSASSPRLLTSFSPVHSRRLFFALPIAVNHASLVLPTVADTHPDAAPLTVAAKLLSSVFLHREIREKGGAYGGGASHSDGQLSFYSYRDPQHLRTVSTFQSSIDWLAAATSSYTAADVEEALLSLFSGIDSPTAPSQKGMAQFITGLTWEERQRRRERLLAVRREDVTRMGETLRQWRGAGNVCVVGDETRVPEEALAGKEGWKVEKLELGGLQAAQAEAETDSEHAAQTAAAADEAEPETGVRAQAAA